MTNYRANIQAQPNSFIDITNSHVYAVVPNATTNKVENPSFETPLYSSGGVLTQYNWDYSTTPYPVTIQHAFSGSFAWKVRMSRNTQVISYGKTRAIQPTKEFERHDVLSFYCYCIEDTTSSSYNATDYGGTVQSSDHDFVVSIYGVNQYNVTVSGDTGTLVGQHTFTLTSIPKTQLGDLSQGLSGSKMPHFYPWQRVVYKIPAAVRGYQYFYFTINQVNTNPLGPSGFPEYDTSFVIDAVQVEDQPITKSATMYFDGSYESFNTVKYPYDFQWAGEPYRSVSMRSANTRVSGELVDFNEFCNLYIKDISGLSTPARETQTFTKTFADGQHFVSQTITNEPIIISGRIVASSEALFMESFARFQELIGKRPFAQPEPVRLFFNIKFTNGLKLLPVYVDVAYRSGLEQDTANLFQQDIEITFDTISTYVQYQNDSASNMFNDNPLFDQFNTMNIDILRDIGGFVYYNKAEEKWETPSNIGFFRASDSSYTSNMAYGGSGINQIYDTKMQYTVGDVFAIKEDGDGIVWFGGSFDIVEIDAYYINDSNERVDTRLQIQVNNIVGLRRRAMSGTAYVLPEILSVAYPENGPDLLKVEYVTEWQVIALLDAPTRYSMSREQNPPAFVGINKSFGNVVIRAIEFTPDGTMYIGGSFNFQYGGRRFINIAAFKPYGSDAQNISLYKPDTTYGWIEKNFNATTLIGNQGRGVHRANWVNSAVPYCKYGVFQDVGRIGINASFAAHAVHTIAYDALNECLYIGGTFTEVANPNTPYASIPAYRIVKYHINSQTYIALNEQSTTSGINPSTTSPANTIIVRKILVQYTPSGVRLFVCGAFTAVGRTSSPVSTFGVAIIDSFTNNPNAFVYRDTGGGGFRIGAPTASATFYDAIITKDNRVFVAGDFNRLNRSFSPPTVVTGIAEYRYGNFTDITRGMEASYYDDTYEDIPAVLSMSANSSGEIYFVGNFTNIKDRQIYDGVAKWDGEEFYGVGMYFLPKLSKLLQKVYVDQADNVYLFTGPNNQQTTVLRTMLADPISYVPPAGVEVAWMNFPYPALQRIFKAENLQIEFYSKEVVGNKTTYVSGKVNAVCVVGPRTGTVLGYADKDMVFIGGKFDYVKIGDTEFRVNNLVALRYNTLQNPFPIQVLAFSNGTTPYYDAGTYGNDAAFVGVQFFDRNGVTDSQIYAIDVVTKYQPSSGQYVPVEVYVGGRFDFYGQGYEDGSTDLIRGARFKNFFIIDLQLNDDKSDVKFNIPENYEQSISVPYINYAGYRRPGPVGTYGVNDAVYAVKATSGTFNGVGSITDPEMVFFGGSFTEITSLNTTMPARRIGVYARTASYITPARRYYKIDFTTNATPAGAAVNTAFNADIRVNALEYTPWRTTVGATTYTSTLLVGGVWSNSVGSPFSSGGTSITSGGDIVRVGIVATGKPSPQPKVVSTFTTNASLVSINDFAFDTTATVYAVGEFSEPGSQKNITAIVGLTGSDSVSTQQVAIGTWGYIYNSALGVPFIPKYVVRHPVTGALVIAGNSGNERFQPFTDSTAVMYSNMLAIVGANYAYTNVNIPQVTFDTSVTTSTVVPPPRRLAQASTLDVGRPIALRQSSENNTISIPYQSFANSLYDAVPLQTFNCYNNGTATVFPTVTLYCPFLPTSTIYPLIHVITNVTTKQSLYLNYVMRPNEVIRIRTDRERINAISNYRGNITNAILNSKSTAQLNIGDAQLFKIVPGKNVIRYGPIFPLQRYYATGFVVSELVYNLNRNSVVAPIVVSLSWNMAFNSIYDAIYTETNPILL